MRHLRCILCSPSLRHCFTTSTTSAATLLSCLRFSDRCTSLFLGPYEFCLTLFFDLIMFSTEAQHNTIWYVLIYLCVCMCGCVSAWSNSCRSFAGIKPTQRQWKPNQTNSFSPKISPWKISLHCTCLCLFQVQWWHLVIDSFTCVPGIPCCPGGPGSPWGPWKKKKTVKTRQETLFPEQLSQIQCSWITPSVALLTGVLCRQDYLLSRSQRKNNDISGDKLQKSLIN